MKIPLFAIGLMVTVGPTANAQANAAQGAAATPAGDFSSTLPEFEVATVKPSLPNVPHEFGPRIYPGARVVISATPLKALLALAFHLSYWQISGGDAWTGKDEYDVEAKPPENLRSSIKDLRYSWMYGIEDEHLRQMLQALLIDRFRLKFHRETKTGSVHLLERNGKTLRLRPVGSRASANPSEQPVFSGTIGFAGGTWSLFNTTMPRLAKFAADYVLHSPVLDRTELSGPFDYRQPTPLPESDATVVGQFEFSRPKSATMSAISQSFPVTPAAIAGVMRSV